MFGKLQLLITIVCIFYLHDWAKKCVSETTKRDVNVVPNNTPYVVKKSKSCAPEDGQKFARNMLS
jgi:hypothetical protein